MPTIQHSGTLFTRALIPFDPISLVEKPREGDWLYWGHMHRDVAGRDNWKKLVKRFPTIVPLRHPSLISESWKRREGEFEKESWRLKEEWKFLIDEIDPYNPYYLPIDSPQRQDYLDVINKDLGINARTRWKPVHSKKQTFNLQPKEIDSELDFIKPLISRFYKVNYANKRNASIPQKQGR